MKSRELATGLQNARINTAGAYAIVNGYYLFALIMEWAMEGSI